MPRTRKLFIHDAVYFITMSTQQGLPLIAHDLMKEILLSNMARAQELYPVILGDLLTMGNHIHFTLQVINPDDVDQFIGRFKTEVAHAINRLKGVTNITVWNEGYDSPVVLDLNSLIDKVAYIYSNPQKAGLEATIDNYPNLSTWKIFKGNGTQGLETFRISRSTITALPEKRLNSTKSNSDMLHKLTSKIKRTNRVLFSPKACFEALKDTCTDDITYEKYVDIISALVRENEKIYQSNRLKQNKSVIGSRALLSQDISRNYIPSRRTGKRMICLASRKELRIEFIRFFRDLVAQASLAIKSKKSGLFPPGLFPPGGRPLASLLPSAIF